MHFKIVPAIGPRYWVGIMIASICGANIGDFIPDVLKLSDLGGLLMLALIFAVIALANQWSRHGNEALYWLAILVVRAAATDLADLGIHRTHLDYITVSACLTALLVAILALRRASSLQPVTCGLPRTNGLYWLAMLTAGTLGTVLGDCIGHMIHPITVGVPVSAIIATAAVALILAQKTRLDMAYVGAASYWAGIVAIRTWGTNFGDIAALARTQYTLGYNSHIPVLDSKYRKIEVEFEGKEIPTPAGWGGSAPCGRRSYRPAD